MPLRQNLIVSATLAMLAALLAGVAFADNRNVAEVPTDWQASELRDHELVGRIWSAASGNFTTAQEMGTDLALSRFILLGEIHDNPDHHLWQAWAIRTISKLRGARIVEGAPQIDLIAMEMLSVDQYDGIDKFYGRNSEVPRRRKPRAFGRMVNWQESGWPDFKIYEPIIAQALHEQIVVVPASPSRTLNRKVSSDGLAGALSETERARLKLDKPLDEPLQTALIDELRDGHCGLMPEKHFPRMTEVQRFRDATMADALLSVGDFKGAILIAGNGHIRNDRAVPLYLISRGADPDRIRTVAKIEVTSGKTNPADYIPKAPDGSPAVDYAVFTPRLDRPDPCVRMKEQFAAIRAQRSKAKQDGENPGHGSATTDSKTSKPQSAAPEK